MRFSCLPCSPRFYIVDKCKWYGIMNDEEYAIWLLMMQEVEEWEQKEQGD